MMMVSSRRHNTLILDIHQYCILISSMKHTRISDYTSLTCTLKHHTISWTISHDALHMMQNPVILNTQRSIGKMYRS